MHYKMAARRSSAYRFVTVLLQLSQFCLGLMELSASTGLTVFRQ
jgi:hypothetical protein